MKHACLHEDDLKDLREGMIELKGKLTNGLSSRVKSIERMQWWQIGIMVGIIGMVLFGLWYFTTRTLDANAALLERVDSAVQAMEQRANHVR